LTKNLKFVLGIFAVVACSETCVLDTKSIFALGTKKKQGNLVSVGWSQN
jgi:hypothetical protein